MAHHSLHTLHTVDEALAWLRAQGATTLSTDSRHLPAGAAFIAWPGYAQDGRRYVPQALAAGAPACLVEADGAEAAGVLPHPKVAQLAGLKAATGPLAAAFVGDPSAHLEVIAATGTNGKTSTAWWTAQALSRLGRRCGMVGTLGVGEPGAVVSTGLTTPDPVTLQQAFARFVAEGFRACAIEASSIGLAEARLAGTRMAVAQYTNFTQDHLDYHGSMAAYWQAKQALFAWPGLRAAVINVDDAHGAALLPGLAAGIRAWTCSADGRADAHLRAQGLRYSAQGLAFDVVEGAVSLPLQTQLIGDFNVANLLGVIGALRALDVPLADAVRVCADLSPVPGRMQRVPCHSAAPAVVVDYAHTPDALDKALLALRPLAAARGGALWCVFGCGGNRDASKRAPMGRMAQQRADHVVLTSDNPRLESPQDILAQVLAGMDPSPHAARPVVMEARAAAIAHAVSQCTIRDVVLIAGKGHEDYQDMGGIKLPFSDVNEAAAALARRGETA